MSKAAALIKEHHLKKEEALLKIEEHNCEHSPPIKSFRQANSIVKSMYKYCLNVDKSKKRVKGISLLI